MFAICYAFAFARNPYMYPHRLNAPLAGESCLTVFFPYSSRTCRCQYEMGDAADSFIAACSWCLYRLSWSFRNIVHFVCFGFRIACSWEHLHEKVPCDPRACLGLERRHCEFRIPKSTDNRYAIAFQDVLVHVTQSPANVRSW